MTFLQALKLLSAREGCKSGTLDIPHDMVLAMLYNKFATIEDELLYADPFGYGRPIATPELTLHITREGRAFIFAVEEAIK